MTISCSKSEAIGKNAFDLSMPIEVRRSLLSCAAKAERKESLRDVPQGMTPVRMKDGLEEELRDRNRILD